LYQFTRCCIATDFPENFDLDINTAYALLANTTKPAAMAFTLTRHFALFVTMFDIAADAEGTFTKKSFLKPPISNPNRARRGRQMALFFVICLVSISLRGTKSLARWP
jgi:trimethylamine:corrinoid methyltransferase-like protein